MGNDQSSILIVEKSPIKKKNLPARSNMNQSSRKIMSPYSAMDMPSHNAKHLLLQFSVFKINI